MATITQIKDGNNTYIRAMIGAGTITKTNDANLRDQVADELGIRGVIKAANTGALAAISHLDTYNVMIPGVGIFTAISSGAAADNETTFASADAGWLWDHSIDTRGTETEKFVINSTTTHVLLDGWMIDKILIKPTAIQTIKIGTTAGGEEIKPLEVIPANKSNSVTMDIMAEGANLTLYFTGSTVTTTITLFKRKL